MYARKARGGTKLKRTQISLAEEEHLLAQKLAEERGVSMSQVIREAIRRYAADRPADDPWDRLLDIVGIGDSGNPRSSVDHDEVIYG